MVPYGVAGRATTNIVLAYQGVKSATVTFNVVATAPGIYTQNLSGTGPGSILNQDFSVNSAANPAKTGSVVAVYMTGEGTTIGNTDGTIATTLKSPVATVRKSVDARSTMCVPAGHQR